MHMYIYGYKCYIKIYTTYNYDYNININLIFVFHYCLNQIGHIVTIALSYVILQSTLPHEI